MAELDADMARQALERDIAEEIADAQANPLPPRLFLWVGWNLKRGGRLDKPVPLPPEGEEPAEFLAWCGMFAR
jgi:hypothetical protein